MPVREVRGEPIPGQFPALVPQAQPLHARHRAEGAGDRVINSLDPLDPRRHGASDDRGSSRTAQARCPAAGSGRPLPELGCSAGTRWTRRLIQRRKLRQEIRDENPRGRGGERRNGSARIEDLALPVSPAERCEGRDHGVTVDLERLIDEVHDPVVGHATARVEARLVLPVEGEDGIGDLDHEDGVRRVSRSAGPGVSRHQREIGLGL